MGWEDGRWRGVLGGVVVAVVGVVFVVVVFVVAGESEMVGVVGMSDVVEEVVEMVLDDSTMMY